MHFYIRIAIIGPLFAASHAITAGEGGWMERGGMNGVTKGPRGDDWDGLM